MAKSFALQSVQVSRAPEEVFAAFLKRRGKRVTRQRQRIVEQVFSHHDHFDADELIEHLQELIAKRQVSRPTVYRTLAELVEAGLLRKMTLAGRSVYEHDYGYPQHDHLYCQVCNRLIEFQSRELEHISHAVAKEHCFEIACHRMFITGVCADCRRSKSPAPAT